MGWIAPDDRKYARTHRWVCFLLLILLSGCRKEPPPIIQPPQSSSSDPASQLQAAIDDRRWSHAEELAHAAMIAHPNDPTVLTNAAVASANMGKRVEAAQLMVDAARACDYSTSGGRVEHAVLALLDVGRVYDAIDLIEQVLQKDPGAAKYRRMLVGFLSEVQLTGELDEHLSFLFREGQVDLPILLATTETQSRRFSTKAIDRLLEKNPDDLRPRLGIAYSHLSGRRAKQSEDELRRIIQHHPDFAPAHALLGRALVEQGKVRALSDWHQSLPEGTSDFPGYWIAMGAAASTDRQLTGAVRAQGEACRRAPNDSAVWARFSAALRALIAADAHASDSELAIIAAAAEKRTNDLLELREHFSRFVRENDRQPIVAVSIAEQLLDLGRHWEAEAWLRVAGTLQGEPVQRLAGLHQEAIRRISQDPQWQSLRGHPELDFDLQQFPRSDSFAPAEVESTVSKHRAMDELLFREIRLRDEAKARGLTYYGEVGGRVLGPLVPIHQTLGCGGGVIDLDNDGQHDVVLAAAGGSIRRRDGMPGAIFRNLDGMFDDVTWKTGFDDPGFGHGVAVGDYNDDGFQDILVLNLGRNSLYRNNGDGTFQDASADLPHPGQGDWSTCAAIMDINGDGYNDFVVVNYCDANQPIDEPCFHSDGQEINCYPRRFLAGTDQFIQGKADGSFGDVSDRWPREAVPGRGLGVIAGRLDGTNMAVYVVNDASVNHFYRWDDQVQHQPLIETAVASGVAVDAQSLHQGSMGIASSDFDADGDLDFYVTGFEQEYNILYEQQGPGLWADQTAHHDLVASTLDTVGFGTEAIDFDNDGFDELIVSNGHVGDFGAGSPPYAQPIQCFRRLADGRYEALALGGGGAYFRSPHIGRALFSCDADADGRSDVVVTHMTEPVALLMNRSDGQHRQIIFQLVDTHGPRDAIGAIVDLELEFETGQPQPRRLFRLSGHGYLCSNRPEILCGAADARVASNVTVTWPDGESQPLGELKTNAHYLIVRGQASAFRVRQFGGL